MRENPYKKMLILGIILILIGTNILPGINAKTNINNQDTSTVTLFAIGETQSEEKKIDISTVDAEIIFNMFKELKEQITQNPNSEKTQDLRNKFVSLLDEKGMLPKGVTKNKFISLLSPPSLNQPQSTIFNRIYNLKKTMMNPLFSRIIKILNEKYYNFNPPVEPHETSATLNFCTIASFGDGYTIPVMIPPRPRIGIVWDANFSETYAGEVFSNRAIYATGSQFGSTVGFTGGGGTFVFPWAKFYVFVGYTWHVEVNAEHITFFPPNYEPEISDINPPNKAVDVPVSLSELSFKLYDIEGAPMDYEVTTYPDIGSGEGNGKPNGVYSIPVSNLDGSTTYTWTIQVSDDKNNIEKSFTFTTELEYPIVSDPSPSDGETWVPTDITELSFKINDPQHDPMDYTVETAPDIGSDSATDVSDGTYTCDINNLEYTTIYKWYINVTDGEHITQKTYSFQTQPIMVFDPFEEGWMYRKNITINHTKVAGNLNNFPVLISITDEDLKNKAQNDGDDILFMDDIGVASKLFHEIEKYDSSTGELVAWVKIPDLPSTVDTKIWMYYNNPGAYNQEHIDGTWDDSFLVVYHMNDADDGLTDSTSNSNDATEDVSDPHEADDYHQEGKIGYAVRYQGQGDDGDSENHVMPQVLDNAGWESGFSLEVWVKPATDDLSNYEVLDFYDVSYISLNMKNEGDGVKPRFLTRDDGNTNNNLYNTNNIIIGDWYYHISTYNGNDKYTYINGSDKQHSTEASIYTTARTNNIGANYLDNWGMDGGLIDEIRISNVERSSSWIKTSYNTMNDPSSFFSVGLEESTP